MTRSVPITLAVILFILLWDAGVTADKPLTTIEYTEFCTKDGLCIPQFIPDQGLKVGSVTYRARPDASDTFAFATYGDPTFLPGGGIPANPSNRMLNNPVLSGSGAMTLTLTFDKPTNVVNFSAAVAASQPAGTVKVTLFKPGTPGRIRQQTIIQPNVPGQGNAFLGAQFAYNKAAVKYVEIVFAQPFALDNLQFHE
jgi:hypothetical protein